MATKSTTRKRSARKTDPQAAKVNKAKASNAPSPCGCGCGTLVPRRFAPGHDAKLKSRLAQAVAAGEQVTIYDRTADPMIIAGELGWADLVKVQANRIAAKAESAAKRAAAKAEKASKPKPAKRARKAAAKAAEPTSDEPVATPGFHPVKVKIGRATYDANVEAESVNELTVSYLTRSGNRTTTTVKRSQVVG